MIATRWFTEAIHAYVKGILVAWCSIDHLFRQRVTLIAVRFTVQFTTFMRQYCEPGRKKRNCNSRTREASDDILSHVPESGLLYSLLACHLTSLDRFFMFKLLLLKYEHCWSLEIEIRIGIRNMMEINKKNIAKVWKGREYFIEN